jgi:hypothetical protein
LPHKNITLLFKALAWHRINPFANPIKDRKIDLSNSANTLKKFKEEFKDAFAQREDVATEQEQRGKALPKNRGNQR